MASKRSRKQRFSRAAQSGRSRLAWDCAKKGQGMAALTTIIVFIVVVLALNILDYGRVD